MLLHGEPDHEKGQHGKKRHDAGLSPELRLVPHNPVTSTGTVAARVRLRITANRNSVQLNVYAKSEVALTPGIVTGGPTLKRAPRRLHPSTRAPFTISTGTYTK